MIEPEVDGVILAGGDKAPIIGACACLPDLSTAHFEKIDAPGAIALFEGFPWGEHQQEAAARAELHLHCVDPGITFSNDSSFIWLMATGGESCFNAEISLPGVKKTLGVFRFAKSYSVIRVERSDVPELIAAFFDPSEARRLSRIEAFAEKYAG